jgi:Ca-activated chloride channel family protein
MDRRSESGNRRQTRVFIAGGLVLATALAGTAARGKGSGIALRPVPAQTRFSAPVTGPVTFTGTLDRTTVLHGADGLVRMELVIGAAQPPVQQGPRVPTDLMVILDRSGSMDGEKLEEARAAIRALVAQLDPQDRFGLVVYSNDATLVIPLANADAGARDRWLATVAAIHADGGTNMSSGLDLGLDALEHGRAAGHAQRAILLSDGLANHGDASHDGLVRRAARAVHGEYMLTTVGIGADFNEELMTALADAGTGNYYYIRVGDDLASVFAREFGAARTTVASGLAVRIEPGRGVRVVDAAGYPLEAVPGAVRFRPGSLFAGQQRHIWVTLAVPSQAVGEADLGRFTLSYGSGNEPTTLAFTDVPRVACVQSADDFYAGIDVPSWSRSVVVDAYNSMQQHVARAVKAGRRDEAMKAIGTFRAATAPMNAHLQSPAVAAQLQAVDKLEADVGAAFNGPDQAAKQNELSKARSAEALDLRRAGSK